jgi:hypothetical protein
VGSGAEINFLAPFLFVLTLTLITDMAYVLKQTGRVKQMAKAKQTKDMTYAEREAHWEKERAKKRAARQDAMSHLSEEQAAVAWGLYKQLREVLEVALYPDNGGIKYVSAYDLQELELLMERFGYQFNMRGDG